MIEEISNEPIRTEKIKRFKERVLRDVEKRVMDIRAQIRELERDDTKMFSLLTFEDVVLNFLAIYLFESGSMTWEDVRDGDVGRVIYIIPTETIDVWLQDDYSFVDRYLQWCYDNKPKGIPLLTDEVMAYHFIQPN